MKYLSCLERKGKVELKNKNYGQGEQYMEKF